MSRSILPLVTAIAVDRARLDQRWAQAGEWFAELDAPAAMELKRIMTRPSKRSKTRAIDRAEELERIKNVLALLAFDTLVDGCMEQTIGLNEDPQSANADAVGEEQI